MVLAAVDDPTWDLQGSNRCGSSVVVWLAQEPVQGSWDGGDDASPETIDVMNQSHAYIIIIIIMNY